MEGEILCCGQGYPACVLFAHHPKPMISDSSETRHWSSRWNCLRQKHGFDECDWSISHHLSEKKIENYFRDGQRIGVPDCLQLLKGRIEDGELDRRAALARLGGNQKKKFKTFQKNFLIDTFGGWLCGFMP